MTIVKKSLGALLKDTLSLIKEHLASLAGLVAVVYIPLCCLFLLFFGSAFIFKDKIDMLSANKSILAIILFIIFFAILVTITFLAMMIFSIAVIKKIKACDEKKNFSLKEAYQVSGPLLGPFCIVILWVLVKVSLWSLLLIVPGVIFALFYSFAQIAFILDGKQGLSALEASRTIIQPFFWEFAGKSFVAGLIFFATSAVFKGMIHYCFPLSAGWHPAVASILENLANGFLGIFPITFGYFLYKDLKERVC
jgi:hypothetical protein